ncbi:MAG: hypothetical protein CL663_03485 [Bacteroidetes bacterium]|nr:hypothetical protein [Bacteroidota bacterium]
MDKKYILLTIVLFIIELGIAIFINDRIIRPYIGDFLVVILMYCFIRSFFEIPIITTLISVLLFAYIVEFMQYVGLIQILGIKDSKLANIILGNSFEWIDIIAYTSAALLVMIIEKIRVKNR